MPQPKKLILIVIDGLTPAVFERAVEGTETPALALLAAQGSYRRALSTFPSLTPVCASSIATGAHADVHGIPHLVWYDRKARRLIEYGSSWGALVAAGTRRSILDTIFHMSARHLAPGAVTVFEALEDAGLVTAAVNFTCYRGRTPHRTTLPGVTRTAHGPRRFFYYSLFESDATGAPLAVRRRAAGTIDEYAGAVGRWLVTRDGFDFLVYYLSDYDYASHALGPDGAAVKLVDADRAVGALLEAAGGEDEFLDRYAVLLCSDHGQTPVHTAHALEAAYADLRLVRRGGSQRAEVAVCASNRAAQIYRLASCKEPVRALAERLDRREAVDVAVFLEDGDAVARGGGSELRFRPDGDGWHLDGDAGALDHPDATARVWAALHNPNAGDVLVSAAEGFEFTDLGGRHHAGGGSHGSLAAGDSEVPMLAVGVDPLPSSITELAPSVLGHFGVEPPPSMRRPLAAHVV
ncbi:MAG TPA: alkaline phosphatase family protein [Gaiellaceae bacterium]|nr:alkaline phosphatase family protein [Gaiellaceae bacterium]